MNYSGHIVVAIGTAGLAIVGGQVWGLPKPDLTTLLTGCAVIAAGAVAVDIDHPRSFISSGLPRDILDRVLPVAVLVVLFAAMFLTGHDIKGLMSFLQASWVKLTLTIVGLALALMLAAWVISGTLRHRGPLHSLAFSIGMTVVAVVVLLYLVPELSWWWGFGFGWGWLSHVLADGLTQYGVPFWWPLSSRRFHVLPYPGFRWVEQAVWILSVLALFAVVWFVFIKK